MANSRKNLNFNEICRLCLSQSGVMSSIFSSPGGFNTISLPSRIMAFTTIKMKAGDGLPGLICQSCLFTVEQVFEFKQKCEQSDFVLRKYLTVESKKSESKPVTEGNQHINNDFDCKHKGFSNKKYQQDEDNIGSPFLDRNCDFEITNGNGADYYYNRKQMGNVLNEVNKLEEDQSNNSGDKCSIFNGNCEIENIVMVVDPNTEALDDITDNENDEYNNSENSRNSQDITVDSAPHHWLDGGDDVDPITKHANAKFHCVSCNKAFNDSQLLERHSLIHTPDPPFPCDYCHEVFNDRTALKSHWREHAGLRLSCMACGEVFNDRNNLAQHVTIHDKVKPFHCNVCTKAFTYRSDLRKHSVTHTGARPYVCKICNKSFTRSTNLNKHARAHTGNRPFPCTFCTKMFSSRADLTRHSVIHTGVKPYSCDICSLAFNRKDKLTRHIKLHTEDRPHACMECPTSFHRKEELTKHVQFHHFKPDPEYLKEVNSADDTGDTSPKKIKSTVTDGDTEDMVINVDPFQVNNSGEQSSTETRPQLMFSCGICHKKFSDKTYLKKHRQIHSESKTNICTVCNKSFYRRRELLRHEAIHTGYKPFSCKECQKPFARRDKLIRHERTHSYQKLMDCSKCEAKFSNLKSLNQHEETHRAAFTNSELINVSLTTKPFKCYLCDSSYARNENLIKHLKTHKGISNNKGKYDVNNISLLNDPVDYLSKMNPELNVTIKNPKKSYNQ